MLSNAVAFRYNRKERRQIRIARKAELDAKRKLGQIRKILEIPGLAAPKEEEAMSKLASVRQELTRDLFLDHMLTRSERRQQQRLIEAEEATSFKAMEDYLAKVPGSSPALDYCRNELSSAHTSTLVSDPCSDEGGAESSDQNENENSDDVNSVASDLTDEFSGSEVDAVELLGALVPASAPSLSSNAASGLNPDSTRCSEAVSNQTLSPTLSKIKRQSRNDAKAVFLEANESEFTAFLDSFGRGDLAKPLSKAGIFSQTHLRKAGDAVLLGPSVGLKPEEVLHLRKACQLKEVTNVNDTGALSSLGLVENHESNFPTENADGSDSDASVACSDSDTNTAMSDASSATKSTSLLSNASVVSALKAVASPRDEFLAAVKVDWRAVQNSPTDNFFNDREIMLAALKQSNSALQCASNELLDDFEFMMNAVVLCGDALQYASNVLRQDKALVKAAASQDGYALRYASNALRDDRDFVLSVCAHNGCSLSHASPELQNDRDVVITAVVKDGMALAFASRELRSDPTIVRAAVSQAGCALQFATKKQRSDRRTARIAVINDGLALQYAATILRNDEAIVISAISDNGSALQFASVTMRSNRDVVMCAKGGNALKFASPECQSDRDVVQAACSQDGCALQFASLELRRDRLIVRIAAMNDWRAMQWADDALRADRNFILDISSSNWRVLDYASPDLRTEQRMTEVCSGYRAFEAFKISVLTEREAALASALPVAASPHCEKTRKVDTTGAFTSSKKDTSSAYLHSEGALLAAEGASSLAFQVFDEFTTGEQSLDNERHEKSWCSSEDQTELAKKSVRFSVPDPTASSLPLAPTDDFSGCSQSLIDPPQPQSQETSTDTPMSVLSPPEESEHTSTLAQAEMSPSSVAHPEVKTVEPCSSSPSSKPTNQSRNDNDESHLKAILDAHGRADLLVPLKKAGIQSPMKFARAGDSLLLSPLLGMKLDEVMNFRLALSEILLSPKK